MRALLLTAASTLEIVDFPKPEPAVDEVLVAVRACGICGSDIHGWDGSSGRRNPPLVMGHEAAGEIVSAGENVAAWNPGDRVTFDSTIFCGVCPDCRSGRTNLCSRREVIGVAPAEYRRHGAFAEFVSVPARVLHRLPDRLEWAHAAMAEPVTIAMHAVSRVRVTSDTTVAVVGSGMIGLLVIQVLRHAGVRRIIAIDLSDERLELARSLGTTETVASGGDRDPAAEVIGLTRGEGVDVAFEVVGIDATLQIALNSVRRGGHAVLVGNLDPQTSFPLQIVVTRELTLHGTCGSAGEYPEALRLIADGSVRVDRIISAIDHLASGPDWFRRLSAPGGGKFMKVILQP
jgi:L-iditol 2-dehydrogenase